MLRRTKGLPGQRVVGAELETARGPKCRRTQELSASRAGSTALGEGTVLSLHPSLSQYGHQGPKASSRLVCPSLGSRPPDPSKVQGGAEVGGEPGSLGSVIASLGDPK